MDTNARVIQIPFAERPLRTVVTRVDEKKVGSELRTRQIVDVTQFRVGPGYIGVITRAEVACGRSVDMSDWNVDGISRVRRICGPRNVRGVRADEEAERF